MNKLEEIRARLLELANGATPARHDSGACFDLYDNCGIIMKVSSRVLEDVLRTYPQWSGEVSYPVCGYYGLSAKYSFHKAEGMWSGEYGTMRKHYCRWLSENITEGCFAIKYKGADYEPA